MINHQVPKGKTLYVDVGGYTFVGPCHVKLSGAVVLPKTYTDGTPTVQSIAQPAESNIDAGLKAVEEIQKTIDEAKELEKPEFYRTPYEEK